MKKNPYDAKNFEELFEIAHYWIQRCTLVELEKKAIIEIAMEKGILINFSEILSKMNEMHSEELEEWEKSLQD